MIVVNCPHTMTPAEAENVARMVTECARKRIPLVVGPGITVSRLPDPRTVRAKRGPTPRWLRRPAVRSAR